MARVVTLPDGSTIGGIPDNITDDQAYSVLVRYYPEAFKDAGGSMLQNIGAGVTSGVGSLLRLGGQLGALAGVQDKSELLEPTGIGGVGKRMQDWAQENTPLSTQARQILEQQRLSQYEDDSLTGQVKQFGRTIAGTVSDLQLLTNFLAEQIPNIVGGLGVGALAKGAAGKVIADATKDALVKVGVGADIAANAGMQAGLYTQQTFDSTREQLIAQGVPEEQANQQAFEASRTGGVGAAVAAFGSYGIPYSTAVQRAVLGGRAASKEASEAAVRAAAPRQVLEDAAKQGGFSKGALGSAGQQVIQEVGGTLAGNVGEQNQGLDTPLLEGTGQAAGMAALLGGPMGGVAGMVNRSRAQQNLQQFDTAQDALNAQQAAIEAQQQAQIEEQAQAARIPPRERTFSLESDITQQQAEAFGSTEGLRAPREEPSIDGELTGITTESGSFELAPDGTYVLPNGVRAPALFLDESHTKRLSDAISKGKDPTTTFGFIEPDGKFTPVSRPDDIPSYMQPAVGVINADGSSAGFFAAQRTPQIGTTPAFGLADSMGDFVTLAKPISEVNTAESVEVSDLDKQTKAFDPITQESLDEMGIPKRSKKLRAELEGLDWLNPDDRVKIFDALDDAGNTTTSKALRDTIEGIIDAREGEATDGPNVINDRLFDNLGVRKQAPIRKRLDGVEATGSQRDEVVRELAALHDRVTDPVSRGRIRAFADHIGGHIEPTPGDSAMDSLAQRWPNIPDNMRASAIEAMDVLRDPRSNKAAKDDAVAQAQDIINSVEPAEGGAIPADAYFSNKNLTRRGADPLHTAQDAVASSTNMNRMARDYREQQNRRAELHNQLSQAEQDGLFDDGTAGSHVRPDGGREATAPVEGNKPAPEQGNATQDTSEQAKPRKVQKRRAAATTDSTTADTKPALTKKSPAKRKPKKTAASTKDMVAEAADGAVSEQTAEALVKEIYALNNPSAADTPIDGIPTIREGAPKSTARGNFPKAMQSYAALAQGTYAPNEVVSAAQKRIDTLRMLAGDIYAKDNNSDTRSSPSSLYKLLTTADQAVVDAEVRKLKGFEERGKKAMEDLGKRSNETDFDLDDIAELQRGMAGTTDANLNIALRMGDTQGALNAIATNPNFPPTLRIVASMLLRHSWGKRGAPKVRIVSDDVIGSKADGRFVSLSDTIELSATRGMDGHAFLHEAVHGFLHRMIMNAEHSGVDNTHVRKMRELYDVAKRSKDANLKDYGFTNLSEFMSEALSNVGFQQFLSTIPYKNTPQSLWQRLSQIVKSALGLKNDTPYNSLLNEILLTADRAMPEGRAEQTLSYKAAGKDQIAYLNRAGYDTLLGRAGYNPGFLSDTPRVNNADQTIYQAAREKTNRWIDTLENKLFSFDSKLLKDVRKRMESDSVDWREIKDTMLTISSSQALHAHSLGNVFKDLGNLEYDAETFKMRGTEDANNWRTLAQDLDNAATAHGMSFDQMRELAHAAFVADRTKALRKVIPDFVSDLTTEQVDNGMAIFEAIPELNAVRDKWNAIRKNVIDLKVQAGNLSQEQAALFLEAGEYVPFDRVEQVNAGAIRKEIARNFAHVARSHKIKGSTQEINDVFDNMDNWIQTNVSEAVRNRHAVDMYNTIKRISPDEVEDLPMDYRSKAEESVTTIWVDGVPRKVKFQDPLWLEAFAGITGAAIPVNHAWMKVSNFLRQNIVLNPLFSISQLAQDAVSAMVVSGVDKPFAIPIEVFKEFVKNVTKTSASQKEMYRYGSVGQMDYTAPTATGRTTLETKFLKQGKHRKVLNWLERFAMAEDGAVRQAVYNRTLLESGGVRNADGTITGGDRATAHERAFEFINFRRTGSSRSVNVLRQVVPFFGAYLQAQNVIYKTLTGRGVSPVQRKEAYKRLMSTWTKMAALSFLYSAMVADDEGYKDLDPAVRARHLVIPGTPAMMPIRNDFTVLPKVAAEITYQQLTGKNSSDGTKLRRVIRDGLLDMILGPTAVPQLVKPIAEVAVNRNFGIGRPIVGLGLENRDKDKQYTTATSELAKAISKYMPGTPLAPVEIDHLLNGFLGTTAGIITLATNQAAEAINPNLARLPKTGRDTIASIPGMSTFYMREQGAGAKNDFYELRQLSTSATTTKNFLGTHSYDKEQVRSYMEDNQRLLAAQKSVNAVNTQLARIRRRRNLIAEIPTSKMSNAEKTAELQRLNEIERRVLKNVSKLREYAGL